MVLPLGDSAPTRIVPIVTYCLIAANVVMYLVQLQKGPQFTTAYAATPYEITHDEDIDRPFRLPLPGHDDAAGLADPADEGQWVIDQGPVPFPVWLTVFTSMFLHAGPLHLAGNMLFLWIFGDNVEEVLGSWRYLLFYLGCGLAASIAQILAAPESYIPTLGASGAIAGVMGAYLVWFPYNAVRVLVFRIITEVPAAVVIGLWIVTQIWMGLGAMDRMGHAGGVAYMAHIGGALAGIAVAFLFQDRARALQARAWAEGF
jgi:membrane associated rhomboid family serine protease